MQNRRGKLILVLAIGASTAAPIFAQKVGDTFRVSDRNEVVSVLINQRELEGEELRLFLKAEQRIKGAFKDGRAAVDVGLIRGLLQDVASLPFAVHDDSRRSLRGEVADQVAGITKVGDPLIVDLLSSGDGSLQGIAIDVLLNQDSVKWLSDRGLRTILKTTLASPGTDEN